MTRSPRRVASGGPSVGSPAPRFPLALVSHSPYAGPVGAARARSLANGTLALDGMNRHAGDFVIRPAEATDLDAIYALECESFVADRLSRRALRRFLHASHRPLLAARSGGRVIGYVLVSLRSGSKSARIYSLAVERRQARRGVGRELLHAAERYARSHGRTSLRLEVRYDNARAIALYQQQGYNAFGRYPAYYADGAEALRFEKQLVPPRPRPDQK